MDGRRSNVHDASTRRATISTSAAVPTTVDGVTGTPVGEVQLEIDYAIIEHFSHHLYSSPHKAIEELVSNSFDALARRSYVYVDGPYVTDRVVVWDNGVSMGEAELEALWWIARSPKVDGAGRVAAGGGVHERKLIGKFGIGKLATYQLGHLITHLCKSAEGYLLVTIDYRKVLPEDIEDAARRDIKSRATEPIVALDRAAARAWVEAQFNGEAEALRKLWDAPTWTVAVIEELKADRIPPIRLAWVLGNSMPLRPDFDVYVNDDRVESRLMKNARVQWDLGTDRVRESVAASWEDARKNGIVEGEYQEVEVELPDGGKARGLKFPALGEVRVDISLFADSLVKGADPSDPRSYGFFVMVRDRLINPDDPLLLLHDPSFGTFYRAQFVIRADGLDADLMADRERVRRGTARTAELATLQEGIYRAARKRIDELDAAAEAEQRSEALLPIASREHYRNPLSALLVRQGLQGSRFDLSNTRVDRRDLTDDDPISVVDAGTSSFHVNATHPFLKAVAKRLGGGKKAREAMRALDLIAIGERLLEGYLFDRGIPEEQVDDLLAWRDGLLRQMARRYEAAPEPVIEEVVTTSYTGGKPFEQALEKLFGLMGFDAWRDGESKEKDVLVIAPIGPEEVRFTVEAKGSGGAVGNDDAEIDIASSHRDRVKASHAIVVAREFTGFKKKGDELPGILEQCLSVGAVSIVTVDALIELYAAIHRYFYPLEMILPVLSVVESPAEKLARVRELRDPMSRFDYRSLLDAIWDKQKREASGDLVPFRTVWQEGWKDAIDFETFRSKLTALEVLSDGLVLVRLENETATLRQAPAVVAEAVQANMERDGGAADDS